MHRTQLLALTLAAGTAHAQTIAWNNAAGGQWGDALNWNPAAVPLSPGQTAAIGLPGVYTVELAGVDPHLQALTLTNADATLTIGAGSRLTLDASATNAGVIVVNPSGDLHAGGPVAFTGAGVLRLGGGGATVSAEPGASFTLPGTHNFVGAGTITAPFDTSGHVLADDPDQPLVFTGAPKALRGLTFADDACAVVFRDTEIDLGEHGLALTYFGEIVSDHATVRRGSFDSTFGGKLRVAGDTTLEGVDSVSNTHVDAGCVLTLIDAPANFGSIVVNPTGDDKPTSVHFPNPGESLSGIGTLTLGAAGANARLTGQAITQTNQHRLAGVGLISTPLTNAGQIIPGLELGQVGTLTADAPIDFQIGATYRCDVVADGQSDRIESTSTFHADGTLWIELPAELTPDDDWSATVVHAESGVTGRFFQVFSTSPRDAGRVVRAVYTPTEIRVASACLADFDVNGQLNFFDVSLFLQLYNAHNRDADLAPPLNTWNFFDISAFLDAYAAGCP